MSTLKMTLFIVFMVLVFAFILCRGVFVNEEIAVRALEAQDFSKVEILSHDWFFVAVRGCGNSDAAKFSARATNSLGKRVDLSVCTGWLLKGATVRTD